MDGWMEGRTKDRTCMHANMSVLIYLTPAKYVLTARMGQAGTQAGGVRQAFAHLGTQKVGMLSLVNPGECGCRWST